MSQELFALSRHQLADDPAGSRSLVIEPLKAEHAKRLGARFAAIDPWASYPYPASALQAYFAAEEAGAPRFAVRLGGELAGAAGLRLNWLRGPYLQFLGVLPEFQKRGLGASVLDWIESEARRGGERNLWVSASDFNVGAIRFYETHGFVTVAPLPDLVRDGRTELLLRKRL
jgi:GNAT superfamily N-acetyltransferase